MRRQFGTFQTIRTHTSDRPRIRSAEYTLRILKKPSRCRHTACRLRFSPNKNRKVPSSAATELLVGLKVHGNIISYGGILVKRPDFNVDNTLITKNSQIIFLCRLSFLTAFSHMAFSQKAIFACVFMVNYFYLLL